MKHFRLRRLVHKNPNDKDSVLIAADWTWKATQVPAYRRKAVTRARRHQSRASRKRNRT